MIHMLSRLDLQPDLAFEAFRDSYREFVAQMQAKGLVEESGRIGRRVHDTPMDTDDEQAPDYYVIMSFRDRRQLDAAYAYLSSANADSAEAHAAVHHAVLNAVFTCWQDQD